MTSAFTSPAGAQLPPERAAVVSVRNVSMSYPGVRALREVSIDILPGEVHCWVGENGAGKSTLIRVLAGAQQPELGCIVVNGELAELSNPHVAIRMGMSFILQELSVVDGLSVADNILLGNEIKRGPSVRVADTRARAHELLDRIGFGFVDVRLPVRALSIAEKQAVMIARALHLDAKVLFLDETTATLDNEEVARLFEVMRGLRAEGRSLVFVSHRLHEVEQIADRVSVFKDGTIVATLSGAEITQSAMVRFMVGRDIGDMFPSKLRDKGEQVLVARLLSTDSVHDVELSVRRGEILGIAGLVGSGRTELLRALFGLDPLRSGSLTVHGVPAVFRSPRDAIRSGLALVPEDRRSQGIVALRSVEENVTLSWMTRQRRRLRWRAEGRRMAADLVEELRIKTPSLHQLVGLLSGGNQQKVVIARWLSIRPDVLLLDEPTRGIDVGAKAEIYKLIDKLARDGMAVVVVSSELPEILGLSNNVLVMHGGRAVAHLSGDTSEEEIIRFAMATEGN